MSSSSSSAEGSRRNPRTASPGHRGEGDKNVERQMAPVFQHVPDAFQTVDIGDFVRIGHDAGGAVREYQPGETRGAYHAGFDMDVGVDEAGQQVGSCASTTFTASVCEKPRILPPPTLTSVSRISPVSTSTSFALVMRSRRGCARPPPCPQGFSDRRCRTCRSPAYGEQGKGMGEEARALLPPKAPPAPKRVFLRMVYV